MNDPFLDDPPYAFVAGQGDTDHAELVNRKAAKGYRALSTVYDPKGERTGEQIVVLMGKHT